jgi:SAM-dependent methyltransferase
MALVIHFVPDPGKAAAEIARVVRPGGIAAAYVWDYTKAGAPTAPLAGAMRAIGVPAPGPPSPQATSREALEELWRTAGLVEIVTRAVDIPVEFADFEDFWQSTAMPVGPAGKAIAALPPEDRARLRSTLEQRVPRTADGRVVYEARASAVQGRRSA